jgi:hypothetical protein
MNKEVRSDYVYLGKQLQSTRLARDISLSEINEQTRIPINFLKAIEDGDLEKLPGGGDIRTFGVVGGIYVKSYVKAYAKYVGYSETKALLLLAPPDHGQSISDVSSTTDKLAEARDSAKQSEKYQQPPKFGEFLLHFFLSHEERVYLIGDLTEEYGEVLSKFGKRKADLWFDKQVFSSLCPLIRRWIYNIRFILTFVEILRRII